VTRGDHGHDHPREAGNRYYGQGRRLEALLRELGSAVIAIQEGSTARICLHGPQGPGAESRGRDATSSTYPAREREEASLQAKQIGIAHEIIESEELDIPGFRENRPDRCYHCKKELFGKLSAWPGAGVRMGPRRLEADDVQDYRPGMKAAKELRVRCPARAGNHQGAGQGAFQASRPSHLGQAAGRLPFLSLPLWDAHLTRGPGPVDGGEEALRALGFRSFRLRHHGEIARIEIHPSELGRALSPDMIRRIVSSVSPWVSPM